MTLQPWYVGQTQPDWNITLSVPGDAFAPDLTGLTTTNLALVVVDVLTNAQSNGLGTWVSIASPKNPAVVVYRPNASDLFVLNAKQYRLYVKVTYTNGLDFFGPYLFTTSAL